MTNTPAIPTSVLTLASEAQRVTVLTGAGMSAESGVPTFRDAQTGLWARYDATALATPEAWERDPALVWSWYMWRHHLVRQTEPNAGHKALGGWETTASVTVVTQNIDDLHERGGSSRVHHLHGSLFAFRCSRCSRPYTQPVDDTPPHDTPRKPPACDECAGPVRPGVVWFGEMLPNSPWEASVRAVQDCDLLLVVGTSSLVYPAAGLPRIAQDRGIPIVEVNTEETPLSTQCTACLRIPAASALPRLADTHVT